MADYPQIVEALIRQQVIRLIRERDGCGALQGPVFSLRIGELYDTSLLAHAIIIGAFHPKRATLQDQELTEFRDLLSRTAAAHPILSAYVERVKALWPAFTDAISDSSPSVTRSPRPGGSSTSPTPPCEPTPKSGWSPSGSSSRGRPGRAKRSLQRASYEPSAAPSSR